MIDLLFVGEVSNTSEVDVRMVTIEHWVWLFENWRGRNALASLSEKLFLFHICNVY